MDNSLPANKLSQLYLIDNRMLDSHLKQLHQHYSAKLELFHSIVANHPINQHLPYLPPRALKTHLPLPNHINLRDLIKTCQRHHLPNSLDSDHFPLLLELSTIPLDTLEEVPQQLLDIILSLLQ
ncbi:hypothetical protein FE333_03495 [Dolosigranulum pigrum]|uniref:hypothetical protein n=1 Tax=Dolosigranulum pigrum TaxID=29394 RepID=UPI001AD8806D|nr:hypothetical protein [Dolosigranulum pigrum]QTJ53229.1 hypothetical protein FE333_03495 [Dolosigranulum pigrum]